MPAPKEQLVVSPLTGYPLPMAAAIWRMIDSRERTVKAIDDLSAKELDWHASGLQNSISTLLYHIAAVEADWLYTETLQQDWPPSLMEQFPYPMRDAAGRLSPVFNLSLSDHLGRLETVRHHLLDGLKIITQDDFYRPRSLTDYNVSPEWVLHHLAQHEDEHRGEITTIRTLFKAAHSSA